MKIFKKTKKSFCLFTILVLGFNSVSALTLQESSYKYNLEKNQEHNQSIENYTPSIPNNQNASWIETNNEINQDSNIQFWQSELVSEQNRNRRELQEKALERFNELKKQGTTQIPEESPYDKIVNNMLSNDYYAVWVRFTSKNNIQYFQTQNSYLVLLPYTIWGNKQALQSALSELERDKNWLPEADTVKNVLDSFNIRYVELWESIPWIKLQIWEAGVIKDTIDTPWIIWTEKLPIAFSEFDRDSSDSIIFFTIFTESDIQDIRNRSEDWMENRTQIFVEFDRTFDIFNDVVYEVWFLNDARIVHSNAKTKTVLTIPDRDKTHYIFEKDHKRLYIMIFLTIIAVGLGVYFLYRGKKDFQKIANKTPDHQFD